MKAEYVRPEAFLNMHGEISIFSLGFLPLERKYLTLLLMMMTGKRDIRDIDVKSEINASFAENLHKLWTLRVSVINQVEEIADLAVFMRPKSKTELRDKVKIYLNYYYFACSDISTQEFLQNDTYI